MKTKLQFLKNALIYYCGFTKEEVDAMTRYEMVDVWMKYNGIIGYTDEIIKVLSSATGVNLEKKLAAKSNQE